MLSHRKIRVRENIFTSAAATSGNTQLHRPRGGNNIRSSTTFNNFMFHS